MIGKLDRDRLADMLHYAKAAGRLASKRHPAGSVEQEDVFLDLCRAVELVGEAATKVSSTTTAALPGIAWKEAIAMRHRPIHGYFSIREDIVFDTGRDDLPQIISALERAFGENKQ